MLTMIRRIALPLLALLTAVLAGGCVTTGTTKPATLTSQVRVAANEARPGAMSLPLDASLWVQRPQRDTRRQLRRTSAQGGPALWMPGTTHSNGRLKNGHYDGNAYSTVDRFDFVGRVLEISFLAWGENQYMSLTLGPEGLPATPFSTHNSWAGSVVLPQQRGTLRVAIATDGRWEQTVRDGGGRVYSRQSGRLSEAQLQALRSAPLTMAMVDNYAGRNAYLSIYSVRGLDPAPGYAQSAPWQEQALREQLAEPLRLLEAGFSEQAEAELLRLIATLKAEQILSAPLNGVVSDIRDRKVKAPLSLAGRILLAQAQRAGALDDEARRREALFRFGLLAGAAHSPAVVEQTAAHLAQASAPQDQVALLRALAAALRGEVDAAYDGLVTAPRPSPATTVTAIDFKAGLAPLYQDRRKLAYYWGIESEAELPATPPAPVPTAYPDLAGKLLQPATAAAPQSAAPSTPQPAKAPASAPAAGQVLD